MTRTRTLTLAAAVAAVALTAAACSSPTGGGGGGYAAAAATADVTTSAKAVGSAVTSAALGPGTALVDGTGRALYLFDGDTGTASTCAGTCATVWPPLPAPADPPTAAAAGPDAQFGSAPRADGTTQLTYHGHPLYYYVGDQNPGDTRGQGLNQFGAHWYLVQPDGAELDND